MDWPFTRFDTVLPVLEGKRDFFIYLLHWSQKCSADEARTKKGSNRKTPCRKFRLLNLQLCCLHGFITIYNGLIRLLAVAVETNTEDTCIQSPVLPISNSLSSKRGLICYLMQRGKASFCLLSLLIYLSIWWNFVYLPTPTSKVSSTAGVFLPFWVSCTKLTSPDSLNPSILICPLFAFWVLLNLLFNLVATCVSAIEIYLLHMSINCTWSWWWLWFWKW